MAFPSPSEKQAKVLWFSLTALAVAVFLALVALMLYGVGWLLDRLSPVLLPLSVAGIIAYLLNPVVNFFEPRVSKKAIFLKFQNIANPRRLKSIVYVFVLAVLMVMLILSTVIPSVVYEFQTLYDNRDEIRTNLNKASVKAEKFFQSVRNFSFGDEENPKDGNSPEDNATNQKLGDTENKPQPSPKRNDENLSVKTDSKSRDGPKKSAAAPSFINTLSEKVAGQLGVWAEQAAGKVLGWFAIIVGMALVPVYVFYFLLEARRIEGSWTDYLPLMESRFKEEVVYVLNEFNNCLIVFFRCQVLVAVCVGFCLAVGFWIIGMPHGILLGLLAGMVGIIPYFGVIISTIPVLALSIAYADKIHWVGDDALWAALLSLSVCGLVLLLEKTVIQPKIVGDRVGMHPVAVIIAVLMGTALVGGILGGLLAIPIVMAGRTLLFRYVWTGRKKDESQDTGEDEEPEAEPKPA